MKFGKWRIAPKKKRGTSFLWVGIIFAIIAITGFWYLLNMSANGSLFGDPDLSETASTTDTEAVAAPAADQKPATGASPSRSRTQSTVVEVAKSLSGTSQFNTLFKSTGAAASITGPGPYTIFVPTNGAFSQLPPGTITKMTAAQKLRFMQYHVIAGRMIDSEAQVAGTIQALSGDALNFSFGVDQIPLVNSAIFIEKHQASNGVVYLIDNVLLPPQRL
jgi:uncharacterized surface protein with fasciclin (FAS1) repeats